LLDERPDVVVRRLRRVVQAADWAKTHPREARRTFAADVGASEAWEEAILPRDLHLQLGLDLSEQGLAALKSQLAFLREQKLLDVGLDLDAWVRREPLERALTP